MRIKLIIIDNETIATHYQEELKEVNSESISSKKGSANNSFTLIENEEIISDEKRVAQVPNDCYGPIVSKLNLPVPPVESEDYVEKCILRYRNHLSIIDLSRTFAFIHTTQEKVENIINGLQTNKSQPPTDIPIKIIKKYSLTFAKFLSTAINESFDNFLTSSNLQT